MKRKILLLGLLLGVTSIAALAVAVRTTCGIWTYTLSKEEYYSLGQDDGKGYNNYLMEINFANCGIRALPRVFEEVEL